MNRRLIALRRAAATKPAAIRERLAARGLVLRTIELEPADHTRLHHAVAVTGRPTDDILAEAIREWSSEVLESASRP